MIKKNIKLLVGIVIGIMVSVSTAYGAGKLYASSIDVDTSKMSELGETSNVNLALNYLYGKAASVMSNSGPSIYPSVYRGVIELYLDPTDLTKTCNYSNSSSTGKSGCMKWYIYKTDNTSYTAILDHNTTVQVAYNSTGSNATQKEVATALTSDTANWGIKDSVNLNPRLITADEVAHITGADFANSWSGVSSTNRFYFDSLSTTQVAKSQGASNYAWLFDYTSNCISNGCNISGNITGYWTSTSVKGSSNQVWTVDSRGSLNGDYSVSSISFGLRPVIEIPKSIFS